jgi:hypothetical protein
VQESHVFEAVFAAAARAFRVFQLQVAPTELPEGAIAGGFLSYRQRVDDLAIVALDLRSDRTPDQILRPSAWDAVLAEIEAAAKEGPRHLLVVSGPPLVFPSAPAFEWLLDDVIPGEQDVEDDLRDRWGSKPHGKARARLVKKLLAVAKDQRVRVTLLSGDVHMAALGRVTSSQAGQPKHAREIYNLVSSPIVHSPPPRLAIWALRVLKEKFDIAEDVKGAMIEIPKSKRPYLARRNFLLLRGQADGALRARWYVEDPDAESGEKSYELAIDPVAR